MLASSQPSLTALDLSPGSSLASSPRNNAGELQPSSSTKKTQHNDDKQMNNDEEYIELEQSIMRDVQKHERFLVRTSSKRLRDCDIRSTKSFQASDHLGAVPLAADTTGTLEPFTSTSGKRNDVDLENTFDSGRNSLDKMMSNQQFQQLGRRSSFGHSIRKSMSMIVTGAAPMNDSTESTCCHKKKRTERWIRIIYNIFIFFCAFWALYADDLSILCFPAAADVPVLILSWCVFGLFLFEFIMFSTFVPNYLKSSEMWMEALVVLSLLPLGPHILLYGTIGRVNDELEQHESKILNVLRTASTINMIFHPIRAASMAKRTANSAAKLLEYTTDLLEGIVAVAGSSSPTRDGGGGGGSSGSGSGSGATPVVGTSDGGATTPASMLMLTRDRPKLVRSYTGMMSDTGSSPLRRQSSLMATMIAKLKLRRTSSGNMTIHGDLRKNKEGKKEQEEEEGSEEEEKEEEEYAQESMLGTTLLGRTNVNMLIGLIVIMPAMSLLQTYAVDLSPQQGLTLLHETNCMDTVRASNVSQLTLSASTYMRITERRNPVSSFSSSSSSFSFSSSSSASASSSSKKISSTLSRNPTYQILSVVLCGQQIYDPFQIHSNVPSSWSVVPSSGSVDVIQVPETTNLIANFLNMRPSEFFFIFFILNLFHFFVYTSLFTFF